MLEPDNNPKFELPLRQQMLLVFTVVMVVFSIGLSWVVDHNLRASAVETVAEQNAQDAMFFANLLDNDMEQMLGSIQSRADNLNDMGLIQKLPKLEVLLNNLQRSKPSFSWIGYTDTEGQVLAATNGMLKGVNVSQRPWFQLGLKKSATVDVHEAVLLSKLLTPDNTHPLRFVDVVSPVKSRDGVTIGVLGAHLSVDWLSQQMNFYAKSLLKHSDYKPSVIGKDGTVRFGREQEAGLVQALKKRQEASNAQVQWFMYSSPIEGDQLVAFAKHQGSAIADDIGWTTLITIPKSLIDEQVRSTRLLAFLGISLASFVAWLTLWWLLRIAGQPVRVLMREIKKSRETHNPLTLHTGLPKEFVDITKSINDLLISIQSRELLLEQALMDMRDSFTGVTASFPGVLFRVEEAAENQFVFSYLSPSARHYLNLDMTVMPLSTDLFYAQVAVDIRDQMKQKLREQAFSQGNMDITMPIQGQDGKLRQMRIRGQIRIQEKGLRTWDGVMVDVSDLLHAQELAMKADNAKSKFLATMSHEIRTPLNGILGFAQILLQEVETEQQRSDVRKIIDTSETLTRILNDILDFSKIEEGKVQLEARPFDLSELVESSASLFHVEARKRQIDFTVDMAIGHPYRMLGDPTRLRQILNNLLSNAIKFTSVGAVRLEVRSSEPHDERSRLHLVVSDTGMGMTVEQQQRLFQRFEQSDTTIFRRFGGSGLGLAIVKGLLDAMGGRVKVTSSPQNGTRFDIELDLPVLRSVETHQHLVAPVERRAFNILVVDDVPMNREMICRFLRKEGHTVQEAENGLQASELARDQAFDVILMDVDMPVCNGLDATRAIRGGPGLSQGAHIIALTGYAFEKDINNVLACGMNAHLAKPINFKKLRALIESGTAT
jgi:signal transduction histidine kinase/ActR/RegA family two-component response regulator